MVLLFLAAFNASAIQINPTWYCQHADGRHEHRRADIEKMDRANVPLEELPVMHRHGFIDCAGLERVLKRIVPTEDGRYPYFRYLDKPEQ